MVRLVFTALITSLFFNSSLAQDDIVLLNDGDTIKGWVSHFLPTERRIYLGGTESDISKIRLKQISKMTINGQDYSGDINWKTIDCKEFPYISRAGVTTGFSRSIQLNIPQGEVLLVDIPFKRLLTSYLESNPPSNWTCQSNSGYNQIKVTSAETYIAEGYSGAIIQGTVKIEDNKIEWSVTASLRDNPNKSLTTALQGYGKKFKIWAYEAINTEISYLDRYLKNFIAYLELDVIQRNQLAHHVVALRNHLRAKNAHPIEGIWSAEVSFDITGQYYQPQAHDIAIIRKGSRFIMYPLLVQPKEYDNSVKELNPSAEDGIFFLEADFKNGYQARSTLYQISSGQARFDLQIPEKSMQEYCASKGLVYTGNRAISYKLTKRFPMKDSSNEPIGKDADQVLPTLGTGFAISSDGLIATNHHMVEGMNTIHVRGINGKKNLKMEAEVVAVDELYDLALIKVTDSQFKSLGEVPYRIDPQAMRQGSGIRSMGYPNPSLFTGNMIVTEGIISSTEAPNGCYYMTADIASGNSGGPIFNNQGQVVAVSVRGWNPFEIGETDYLGMDQAIKSKHLIDLLNTVTDYQVPQKEQTEIPLEEQVDNYQDFIYLLEVSN